MATPPPRVVISSFPLLRLISRTVVFSVAVIFIKDNDISYFTQNGTSTVLAPIASGAIRGIIYAYTLRLNGSAGGVDVISSVITKPMKTGSKIIKIALKKLKWL